MARSIRGSRAALVVVGTAAIYWLAARLALLMAIPPGYATAVWPAAGLALICVLAWGPRAAACVALGSCLVNLGTSFDGAGPAAVAHSFAIAGAIGLGARAQAALGAALIRRRIGFPSGLHDERDIIRFILLGGPVACLASCTIGVTSLTLAGVLARSSLAFHWWTWWVGDTIGVLVFAPLALLVLPTSHAVWRRRRALVGIPLVLGFAAVTMLFVRVSAWERARLRTEFERRAAPLETTLISQLSLYEEVVISLTSLFDASSEVTRAEFHAFCARALARYPAILALSWNPRVPAALRADLEECQTRVQAIALIHEKLYQSRDYASVPFSEYTRTLASNVFHTMGMPADRVELDLAIEDIAVPIDKAIPCGLLLNELITNALKHAFRDGRRGTLRVELGRRGDRLRLIVQDDGVGLPPGMDVRGTRSFGLQLVVTLAEQLGATLTVADRGGARFELDFAAA